MHRDPIVGPSSPYGHQQCLQGEVGGHAGLGRPSNDTSREQVDDDAEVQPAFIGPNVGDVRHPDLIGPGRLEALLQPVLRHHRGLAAISAGTTPVADLRSNSGQRRQQGNTVLRDAFTLVAQIVRQLAPYGDCQQSPTGQWIAIDLATLCPGLPDQLGLTCILLRAMAQRLLEPCIEAGEVDPQHPAHGPDAELLAMRPDEGVLHWDSRAKYAVAFFRMSRSSVTRASSRFSRRFSASWSTPGFGDGSPNSFTHL